MKLLTPGSAGTAEMVAGATRSLLPERSLASRNGRTERDD